MIKKLDELTQEERQKADAFIKTLPKPRTFDRFGLAFDQRHLHKIGCTIILLPLECMAEYVDCTTWNAVQKGDETTLLRKLNHPTEDFAQYGATDIGNLAYVALRSNDKKMAEVALGILNNIYRWHRENIARKFN